MLWAITVSLQFNYHKSLPLLNVTLRTLHFYPAHSMRSLTLGCLLETLFICFRLTHPLVTVCVLLLDLVIALAKFSLVLVFSLKTHPSELVLFHNSPLWEPSPNDHSWHLFCIDPDLSALWSGQKTCSWQYNWTPTVIKVLCYSSKIAMSLYQPSEPPSHGTNHPICPPCLDCGLIILAQ